MGGTLTSVVTATVMNAFILLPSGGTLFDYSTVEYQVLVTENSITYVF